MLPLVVCIDGLLEKSLSKALSYLSKSEIEEGRGCVDGKKCVHQQNYNILLISHFSSKAGGSCMCGAHPL